MPNMAFLTTGNIPNQASVQAPPGMSRIGGPKLWLTTTQNIHLRTALKDHCEPDEMKVVTRDLHICHG